VQEPLVGDMKDFKTMKLPSSAAFWVGGGGGGEVEGRWRGGGGVAEGWWWMSPPSHQSALRDSVFTAALSSVIAGCTGNRM